MSDRMTWQEKFMAILVLGDASLRMRAPDDWCVDHRGVEIKKGSMLTSRYGNGPTPEDAVLDHWRVLTELGAGERIVLNAMMPDRREVLWNGFMWAEVHG